MDYRKILAAYIDHVGNCEGVDFLPSSLAGLSDGENAELARVAAGVYDETLPVVCQDHQRRLLEYADKLHPKAA